MLDHFSVWTTSVNLCWHSSRLTLKPYLVSSRLVAVHLLSLASVAVPSSKAVLHSSSAEPPMSSRHLWSPRCPTVLAPSSSSPLELLRVFSSPFFRQSLTPSSFSLGSSQCHPGQSNDSTTCQQARSLFDSVQSRHSLISLKHFS
jgi:hypothetical protein